MQREHGPSTSRAVVEEPERMNLLGLLMHGLLSSQLEDDRRFRIARAIRGDVHVRAARMSVTLSFGDQGVRIRRGNGAGGAKAWVEGSLGGMLKLVTVRDPIGPLLTREFRFGGNPVQLLRVALLLVSADTLNERLRELGGRLRGLLPFGLF